MITWVRFLQTEPAPGSNDLRSTLSTTEGSRDHVDRIFVDGFMLCAEKNGDRLGYPLTNVRSVRYASDEPKKAKAK